MKPHLLILLGASIAQTKSLNAFELSNDYHASIKVGQTEYKYDNEGVTYGLSVGYHFNDWLSIDAEYVNLDSNSGFGASGVVRYPISTDINVFASAGYSSFDFKTSAGVEMILTESLSVAIEQSHYWEERSFESITANLTYRFKENEQVIENTTYISNEFVSPVEVEEEKSFSTSIHHFGLSSYELYEQNKEKIDIIIDKANMDDDFMISVIGYSDSTGSEKYNLELSERRAKEVAQYLIDNGIESNRIDIDYRGESSMFDNDTYLGRSLNRKVDMKLFK